MNTDHTNTANSNHPSEPPVLQLRLCKVCGAICQTNEGVCWMCRSRTGGESANPYAAVAPEIVTDELVSYSGQDTIFAVLLIACFFSAILVGVGIGTQDPGLFVAYLILIGPAFAITGVRAFSQSLYRGGPKPKALFMSLIISLTVTIGVVGLLAIAAIVLLFVLCISALSK